MTLLSAPVIAAATLTTGLGMAGYGVFLLMGLGWSLVIGSAPLLLLSAVLMRGLTRAG